MTEIFSKKYILVCFDMAFGRPRFKHLWISMSQNYVGSVSKMAKICITPKNPLVHETFSQIMACVLSIMTL